MSPSIESRGGAPSVTLLVRHNHTMTVDCADTSELLAAVERKMVKKALVGHLATTLEHTGSENLLVLAVMFLKKLSVFEGNKNEMRERNLVAKIVARIPSSSEQFGLAALRLLFNLSFDPAIREQMVKAGAIPKFVEMLKHPRFRGVTLRLLYHMSIDDRCKSLFTYTEAIPITMAALRPHITRNKPPKQMH